MSPAFPDPLNSIGAFFFGFEECTFVPGYKIKLFAWGEWDTAVVGHSIP
jgi:hypothetical protein